MIREYNTIREAAELWVGEFGAVQRGMIAKLMQHDPDEWSEVTQPIKGDMVYVYEIPGELDTLEHGGEIRSYDEESELYCIELYDGKLISATEDDFEVERVDMLPMCGTMWQFRDSSDNRWMTEGGGIEVMSRLGFRIYAHDNFGCFFGFDGAGFDFYEAFWEPLYKARGLQWHDPAAEKERQMKVQ